MSGFSGYSINLPESSNDDAAFTEILNKYPDEADKGFSIGFISDSLNWTFNRAARVCYRALSRGLIIRCEAPHDDDFMINMARKKGVMHDY